MTSVTEIPFTDSDLSGLLPAVGAESPADPGMFDDSFGQLDLDSLARTEIATRVAARWGVDIEDQLTPDTTPAEVRRLALRAVNER
ncbi:acyl carrier protein [Actinacidiphila oryziradicis]|jgi:hypothetical protein|uniref:Acyl carrier protein n=1 Tax=Actinacidiphila oryziradicis TaxID=2571141 RepID=A0A4U0SWY5_9ACTN|nr:acyl carrier protein [Actinacidiphila oryziradicis]